MMKHRLLPLLLLPVLAGIGFAQDLAPDSAANVVYEITPQSGVLFPPISVLLGADGIAYRVAAVNGPLETISAFRWQKTSSTTVTLELGSGGTRGQTFITFSSTTGGTYRDFLGTGSIRFTAFPGVANAPLRNVSTRTLLEPGRTLIGGFVIGGNASQRVLVRAVGPGLSAFGVANPAPNPVLRVLRGEIDVASNTGWGGSAALSTAFSAVGAFGLASASRDSTLLLTLEPGSYTAQITSAAAGEVLLEVYWVP